MTIDKLARMSQREFVSVSDRFDRADKRFDKVDEDLGILRRDTNAGFASVGEVLKLMRDDLKDIKGNVITVNEDYTELRARVGRLEKKVGLSR